MILNISRNDLTYSACEQAVRSGGPLRYFRAETGINARLGRPQFISPFSSRRFSDKVKHIKILTKDSSFYIAEGRLFRTVLVGFSCKGFNKQHEASLLF